MRQYNFNKKQIFSIRKFKVGVCSALIGTFLIGAQVVAANESDSQTSEAVEVVVSSDASNTESELIVEKTSVATSTETYQETQPTVATDSKESASQENPSLALNTVETTPEAKLVAHSGTELDAVETTEQLTKTDTENTLKTTSEQAIAPSNKVDESQTMPSKHSADTEQMGGSGVSADFISVNRTYQSVNESAVIRPITVNLPAEVIQESTTSKGQKNISTTKTLLDLSYSLEHDPTKTYAGLPEGLVYDPKNQQISGSVIIAGQYSIHIEAIRQQVSQKYDEAGSLLSENFVNLATDKKTIDLDINALPSKKQATFTNASIRPIAVSGSLTADLTAFTYTSTENGQTKIMAGLPDGLHFNQASGRIEGVPTKVGQYHILAQAISGTTNLITEATLYVTETSTNPADLLVRVVGATPETASSNVVAVTAATATTSVPETTGIATGKDSVAIGNDSVVTGNQSTAVGYGNVITADNAGAFGDPSHIAGNASYGVGNDNYVAVGSSETQIFGNNNQIGGTAQYGNLTNNNGQVDSGKLIAYIPSGPEDYAPNSSIIGSRNYINTNNTYIIGTGVNTTGTGNDIKKLSDSVANSVYLGSDSTVTGGAATTPGTLFNDQKDSLDDGTTTTAGATGTVTEATVSGITYDGFAGDTAVGAVSVGASGAERRLQNLAAGEISASSTDAINGSQLYAVANSVGWNILAGKTSKGTNTGTIENQFISPNETVKLIASDGVNIEQDGNNFIFSVKYDPSIFTLNANGELTFLHKPIITVTENGDSHTINITNVDGSTATTTITNGKDGANGKDGVNGTNGVDGKSPTAAVVTNNDGTHTITITDSDGTMTTATVKNGVDGAKGERGETGAQGIQGARGERGEQGIQGERGAQGLPGANGKDGRDGKDGVNGTNGTNGTDGKDGISPIAKVVDNGDGTYTITITDKNGITSVTVKDGKDGRDGKDGLSPTATVVDNGNGTYTITITDKNGMTSVTVRDGKDCGCETKPDPKPISKPAPRPVPNLETSNNKTTGSSSQHVVESKATENTSNSRATSNKLPKTGSKENASLSILSGLTFLMVAGALVAKRKREEQ